MSAVYINSLHQYLKIYLMIHNILFFNLLFAPFRILVWLHLLSVAFDTIGHDILLHCLQHVFDIQGTVLSWFRPYLTKSFQIVSTQGTHSDQIEL